MYDFGTLRLGFIPTRRDTFPDPAHALAQRDPVRQRVDGLCKANNVTLHSIDCCCAEGLLVENFDAFKVAAHFKSCGVDALFIALCNFGQEEAIAKAAKAVGKPVLLWGPRDPMPPANTILDRQTDTQCGLFAASRALMRYGVPFSYIENCWLESPVLDEGFAQFVRVASVVKAMTGLRIGQMSTRPRQFLSVIVNESELLERFGIEVVPFNEAQFLELVREYLSTRADKTKEMADNIRTQNDYSAISEEKLTKIAAAELAYIELAERYDCRAFASECWDVLPKELGIRPCFLFGDLTGRGLPVSCETDIHGSISSIMLTAAARGATPGFLADITIRHPSNDNAELLWHCGPFPSALSRKPKPPIVDCHGQFEIIGGDITLARLDAHGGRYHLFVGQADGTEGPATNGNYLWIQTNDWPTWERKLIYGPYIHHIAGIHGSFANVLGEACKYLGGIEFDPVN